MFWQPHHHPHQQHQLPQQQTQQYYGNNNAPPPPPPKNKNKPKKDKQDVDGIVTGVITQLKTKGIFDQFRRECLSESDSTPSYINLQSRVAVTVETFLSGVTWTPNNFSKINVRNQMKKKIEDSMYFKKGVENIIEQSLRSKMDTEFIPIIENEVYNFMGCEKKDPNVVEAEEKEIEAVKEEEEQVEFKVPQEKVDLKSSNDESNPIKGPESASLQDEKMDCNSQDDEDEDSEEESPMFEKIGEVSPPRPVLLANSADILRELQEEARRNSELMAKNKAMGLVNLKESEEDCKYLEEPSPLFGEKVAYYKTLPDFNSQ